jgi:hypothetical protein
MIKLIRFWFLIWKCLLQAAIQPGDPCVGHVPVRGGAHHVCHGLYHTQAPQVGTHVLQYRIVSVHEALI